MNSIQKIFQGNFIQSVSMSDQGLHFVLSLLFQDSFFPTHIQMKNINLFSQKHERIVQPWQRC